MRGAVPALPTIDPLVLERFPDCHVLVLLAQDIEGGASTEASIAALRDAESEQRAAFGTSPASAHPHIAAWRRAYGRFGTKPSRYPCSAEALLKRTLKGESLPAINRLVDLYNAISVRHVLPVGGEDTDRIVGVPRLTVAAALEDAGEPEGGVPGDEVVWGDAQGITCRRWNWRQEPRTRLTESTRNALFVLERLDPYPLAALVAAGQELAWALTDQRKAPRVEAWLLPERRRVSLPDD
jgi:DNA/RNA-binding domain of Phe-tRNA-synthetase-like protein